MQIDVNGVLLEICSKRENIKRFFVEELGHLKSDRDIQADIKIVFKKEIRRFPESEIIGNEGEKTLQGLLFKTKQGVKIEIPYLDVGQRITVNCEERINLSSFFHHILKPLIHYRFLGKKKALVHCSALVYKTKGILLFGYGGSGRTTVLLEFLRKGANFVSDDYTVISSDGKFFSFSRKITLENFVTSGKTHFKTFPGFIRRVSKNSIQEISLWIKLGLNRILSWISKRNIIQKCKIGRFLLNKTSTRLKIRKRVLINQLFTDIHIVSRTPVIYLFSLVRYSGKEIEIVPGDTEKIVEEMIVTNLMEHIRFLRNYEMFKFAFPRTENRVIEERETLEREIFDKFLQNKKILRVKVPFDYSPVGLVNQMIYQL